MSRLKCVTDPAVTLCLFRLKLLTCRPRGICIADTEVEMKHFCCDTVEAGEYGWWLLHDVR